MASGTREQILARLFEVLQTVPLFADVRRNDLHIDEHKLPALLLLDGDENMRSSDDERAPPRGIVRMDMAPEVYIIGQEHGGGEAGAVLNDLAARVVYAVETDPTLRSLCWENSVRYEGMQTGFAMGRSVAAEAGLVFSLSRIHNSVVGPPSLPEPETEPST